jgi:hypothetical protein
MGRGEFWVWLPSELAGERISNLRIASISGRKPFLIEIDGNSEHVDTLAEYRAARRKESGGLR